MDSIERIIIEIYCSISSYFINKEPRSMILKQEAASIMEAASFIYTNKN
jgi:hypothetical protein